MSVPLGLVVEVVRYQMCQHELSQLPTPLLINIYLTATPAVIALSYVVLPLPVVSAKPHRHELFVRALALALTLRTIDLTHCFYSSALLTTRKSYPRHLLHDPETD